MPDAFLNLKDVSKRFGRIDALRGLNMTLDEDELLIVLGPTGAGKTTLLRTIVGLESPDSGSINMGGVDILTRPPHMRDIALVFQNFSLYPDWTVRRNMEFPLKAPGRNMDQAARRDQVERVADMLKITHLLDRESVRLSGGEMQRVAIGRAMVRRPKLFLMDEPLTNLDAKLRETLRVELAVLRRELKTPMIYVTHDQGEALSMGDRIVVLSEGRALQADTPEEVYRRPASPEVARQLGQPRINILKVRKLNDTWVTDDGTTIASVLPEQDYSQALIGIRPEDLAVRGGATRGSIEVVEDMGSTRTILATWAGEHIHIIADKSFDGSPGDEISPHAESDAMVFWPADREDG